MNKPMMLCYAEVMFMIKNYLSIISLFISNPVYIKHFRIIIKVLKEVIEKYNIQAMILNDFF